MRTVTSHDGTSLAYDLSGQGPALILVGGAGSTRGDATATAAALASYFTVFAFDRRGRGDSGDTAPYAVAREIEDIAALIDEAGGSAFVFGHSSGGILALEAARLLPAGRITKLAVYEPPVFVDDTHPPMPEGFVAHLKDLIASGQRGEASEAFSRFVGLPDSIIAQMRQSPAWPAMEAIAPSLVYDATISQDVEQGDLKALEKWAAITVPTLVMDGTVFLGQPGPHTFMRHGADAIARIVPHAGRQTLEGQDHGAAPDTLAPALRAFFLG